MNIGAIGQRATRMQETGQGAQRADHASSAGARAATAGGGANAPSLTTEDIADISDEATAALDDAAQRTQEAPSYLAEQRWAGTTLTDDMLDHVWNDGYGTTQNPTTDAQHFDAMVGFFSHLKNDMSFDVARLGANWEALEPAEGQRDPAAEARLKTTLEAASAAGVQVMLGIGAKSASDAGQFRDVPAWANNGYDTDGANPPSDTVLGEGRQYTADSQFGQRVLAHNRHVLDLVDSLSPQARANIVGYQVENEPFDEFGRGTIDPSLAQAEADLVRAREPNRPVVINLWSTRDHENGDGVEAAGKIADLVGFDVYASGASESGGWSQDLDRAFALPQEFASGITAADGHHAGVFISELQASDWTNTAGDGFHASAESVQPLVDKASALGMNVLFWRQNDLEGQDIQTGQWGVPTPEHQAVIGVERAFGMHQRDPASIGA